MSKTPTLASVNGTTLSGAQLKTFLTGIVAAFRTIGMQETDRSTITSDTTLTVQNCGLVLVDCTGGNVALTLPTSGATTDDAIYNIRRLDSTTNTLTVTRGGSDTIEGASTAVSIRPLTTFAVQLPAGAADWKVTALSGSTQAAARNAIGLGASIDIASAATVDLTGRTGNVVRITGTAATTAITMNNGDQVTCVAVGAWPLTYHSTNMPIPGGSSFTCAAGDVVIFTKDNNGSLHISIRKQNGTPIALLDGSVTAAKLNGSQTGSAPIYAARAWVNFNGTGTVAILAAGNVTSITDNGGTGDYTVNMTEAMQDANYCAVAGAARPGTGASQVGTKYGGSTASACRILVSSPSGVSGDAAEISIAIFR